LTVIGRWNAFGSIFINKIKLNTKLMHRLGDLEFLFKVSERQKNKNNRMNNMNSIGLIAIVG